MSSFYNATSTFILSVFGKFASSVDTLRINFVLYLVEILSNLSIAYKNSSFCSCDMMSAAEVEPLHFREQRAELGKHCIDQMIQRIGILLVKRMDMQTVDLPPQLHRELRHGRAEPRVRRAGIELVDLLREVFRVDAQSH